eukprot:CAMPEP_0118724858 /NCGR_PEP_ID=MMETSP0800-20121206/32824_1 /TAXON_ID=210618 ORGANISM="Striatella unipunctata, Strain CCMP2910" /NCGR_SAMPLE_ID=MMETSP0800 /ASSEMBLY_ACC=CAM_ASM_000638 /LENGTH=175 /DNA_ID=CAMNT_0006633505 /DNA_START=293 /DNA_END=820 /DNA_ORIENTATION=-
MKDLGHDFFTIRDGVLTLEDALVGLCGGIPFDDNEEPRSGRDLLDDDVFRADIELESALNGAHGIWNTKETRNIFHEIVQSSTTTGLLSLAFELLCRNCDTYIKATQPPPRASRRQTAIEAQQLQQQLQQQQIQPRVMTRRMNAWQMAQLEDPSPPARTTRRMNAWQQANSSFDY